MATLPKLTDTLKEDQIGLANSQPPLETHIVFLLQVLLLDRYYRYHASKFLTIFTNNIDFKLSIY